ncbi:IkappaB kinase complex, IKAP component [Aureobasidium subglaciale]|nr:IkappaB kinase complex, IKAP component [Aureobasidium subglaciale]
MLSRSAMRMPTVANQIVARRAFSSTRMQLASPYHYPEGPRSNLPFNPLTKMFAFRFWGFMATGFFLPFGVAEFPNDSLPPTATTWDPATDGLIAAFGPSSFSPVIELRRLAKDCFSGHDAKQIASWDALSPLPDLPVDRILSLQYFADTATICLILAGGDIVIVREEPLPGEDLIEIVGGVDEGIAAAAWSPDEELLAISTRANTLILMTRDFESIANITLSPEDIKVSAHVNVGWGKRETQFQGKRAKALKDPTVPEHVDEGQLSSLDQMQTTISWRGDGAYLAVNSVQDEKRRMIRVYSREGVLESVGEPVDGLEGALSWRPAGNLMAGVQRRSDRVDVVFFERNGLRHGQFSLRLSAEDMGSWASAITLAWNNDSTVLAVSFKDRVQLWTMGNYHYYLKQEIFTNAASDAGSLPVRTAWHPEKALYLSTSSDLSKSSATPPNDLGLTSVIDGRNLKITPLRVANVPPPMAFTELEICANAIDVAVSHSATNIAILHRQGVSLYELNYSVRPFQHPKLLREVPMTEQIPRQVAFSGDDGITVLCGEPNSQADSLVELKVSDDNALDMSELSSGAGSLFSAVDFSSTCYEDAHGGVYEIGAAGSSSPLAKLPVHCPSTEVWKDEDTTIVFGLSAGGTLFGYRKTSEDEKASECLQIRNCTSFLTTPAHLIFTTTQHLLKFVHLHQGKLEIPLDEPEKDERCRSIERGARLVAVMPTAFSLVLQMPRGNLETIYPRALVLAGIRRSISAKDYKTAFFACRGQRVDMNILHDYAPQQFMANVLLFSRLTHSRDDDVAETMYKETLNAPKLGLHGDSPNEEQQTTTELQTSKINRVCDAFLDVLRNRTSTHLQNIVTAHVCKSPPDLDAGLNLIAKLRKEQSDLVERAVEHICFLADVNKLYDHALGLYDLDVALLIAQQSQKDPREYLPYVQGLGKMQPLRRQFTIDHDLKKHSKALGHLFTMDEFNEFKTYMAKHELYSDALHLYRYQTQRLNEIMKLNADYLNSRNRYKEAGIAYEYLGEYNLAFEAYRSGNEWRECLSSATLVPLPEDEIMAAGEAFAEALTESKEHYDAATVHLDYLNDIEGALKCLCKGYYYAEAIRVVGLRRRAELITSVIDPGLVEGSATMTELLAEMKTQLNAQVPRLRELRQKKEEDPLAFFGGVAADGPDIPDNISLAPTEATTSAGTFMTRYTNRSTGTLASNATRKTSKNRRREERKRARGKKGSVYEEEYIVNSIGRLIERTNSVSEEVTRLVEGLMRRAMRERAVAVENAMTEVVELCKICIPEVFQVKPTQPPNPDSGEINGEDEAGRPMAGGQAVFFDAMEANQAIREPPVVKAFSRLSLLAGYDHTIRFWEALSGICSRTIPHPDSQVNRLCISPDKRFLAAAGHHTVKLYDIKSTNPAAVLTFEGHTNNITGLAFHCEGKWMVTSSEDGTVKIWDTRTGHVQRNYSHGVPVNDVVIHPNQGELISCDRGGNVRIWDLAENKCSHQLIPEEDKSVASVTVASDGSLLCAAVSNSQIGSVYVWRIITAKDVTTLVPVTKFNAHNTYITRVLLSPDVRHLATCSADHTARIWSVDLTGHNAMAAGPGDKDSNAFELEQELDGHQRWVWDCAFSADSAYLVTACSDHYARLWELSSKQVIRQYNGHHRGAVCVALNDYSETR